MKSLYLRIYVTVVAVLLLFAGASTWLFQRHIEQERYTAERLAAERMAGDRMAAWGELIQRSLPGADAPPQEQAGALREWSDRLRLPLALDTEQGERIVASESFVRRQAEGAGRAFAIRLDDGRTLWVMRNAGPRPGGPPGVRDGGPRELPPLLPFGPPGFGRGLGLLIVLLILFVAVSAGAYPVVRRLTRRLESLKQGVERFGRGELHHRVEVSGRDEVAAVAASFNQAAGRVEALLKSHQSLLANASHELRSPLARMKMAVSMIDEVGAAQREKLKREIDTNVAELDALVEEVLLASRLDAAQGVDRRDRVDLLALAAEEASRVDAAVDGDGVSVMGEERLLRRALRNLLENARRYAGDEVAVTLSRRGATAEVRVCDRGPGVPEGFRERIFEPFFRLPGHAEQAGGVGLGLSLVKQIAERHGGRVRCEARDGGGTCFVVELPAA